MTKRSPVVTLDQSLFRYAPKMVLIGGAMEHLREGCRVHADPRTLVLVDEVGEVVLVLKGMIP
jgi:hypothetical protein